MQGIFESLIDPDWVFAQFAEHTGPMVVWTIAVFLAGLSLGMKIGGSRSGASAPEREPDISLNDLSPEQLSLIERLYDEGNQLVSPTFAVLELEKMGLIKDAEGYDLMIGGNPHEVTLTVKGRSVVQRDHDAFIDAIAKAGLITDGQD